MDEAKGEFQHAALELRTLGQENDEAGKLVDVQVSGDGTRMRRGFSSLYGCFFTISEKTGCVLDVAERCHKWNKCL